jgi:hypothetical protein
MPSVERQIFFQTHQAEFGMAKRPLPVLRLERAQQAYPAIVQVIQHGQRNLDGSGLRVGEFGPAVFGIRLNHGFVLCEGKLKSDVGVQMAVGDVVRDLAHGPALGPVGRVELLVGKAIYTCAQMARRLLDVAKQFLPLLWCGWALISEFANRVAQVVHGSLLVENVASRMIRNRCKVQEKKFSTRLLVTVDRCESRIYAVRPARTRSVNYNP